MRSDLGHLAIISILVTAVACGGSTSKSASDWTQAEKENGAHFIYSMRHAQQAIRVSNEGSAGRMSDADRREILSHMRQALTEAEELRDTVLDKIHPQIRQHYREEFQRGLELRISNLEQGNMSAEMEGSRLMSQWGDWYIAHQSEIRIPKP